MGAGVKNLPACRILLGSDFVKTMSLPIIALKRKVREWEKVTGNQEKVSSGWVLMVIPEREAQSSQG